MAISATLYRFQIELADIDRNVYETLDLRVALHPSEGEARMVVRVLARAVAHEEGLEFGRGLSKVEDATLWIHSPTGQVQLWMDVGCPSAERLHRASKAAPKVVVVTDKIDSALRKEWSSRKIHRADQLEVIRLDPQLVAQLAEDLARSETWYLTLQDGLLTVARGEHSFSGAVERTTLADFLAT